MPAPDQPSSHVLPQEDCVATQRERERERILQAAQRCFMGRGLHATRMETVCEAAGLSAALVHRHFSSKDDIVRALIDKALSERRTCMHGLASGSDLGDGLEAMLHRWKNGPDAFIPSLYLEMNAEAVRNPAVETALSRADTVLEGEFFLWLKRAVAADSARSPELMGRAFVLQCFIEGLLVRCARNRNLDLDLATRSIRKLLDNLLVPEPERVPG